MIKFIPVLLSFLFIACKEQKKEILPSSKLNTTSNIKHAKGFTIEKSSNGVSIINIIAPWPNAETAFTYALVPKEKLSTISLNKEEYDAIIPIPVERIIATSTTHIPALEALGMADKLVGFPNTDFISSSYTRTRIDQGLVHELGSNESLNTETALSLTPDMVIGFGINNQNKAYQTLKRSNIPIVYNGDWNEQTPLGKAEWIKFFAPFFKQEQKADSIFNRIEKNYNAITELASQSSKKSTVLSGGLYKDIWYVSGGKSWMAQYLKDANANYLWRNNNETGSLSLSVESVLNNGAKAAYWINPSMHTSYAEMRDASKHYEEITAFKDKKVYSFFTTKGVTGGILFYELGPNRPDLVLKDLIVTFHPEILPNYQPTFLKPLQ